MASIYRKLNVTNSNAAGCTTEVLHVLAAPSCGPLPKGVNTVPFGNFSLRNPNDFYIYTCLPGYSTTDNTTMSCVSDGAIPETSGPNCTSKSMGYGKTLLAMRCNHSFHNCFICSLSTYILLPFSYQLQLFGCVLCADCGASTFCAYDI